MQPAPPSEVPPAEAPPADAMTDEGVPQWLVEAQGDAKYSILEPSPLQQANPYPNTNPVAPPPAPAVPAQPAPGQPPPTPAPVE